MQAARCRAVLLAAGQRSSPDADSALETLCQTYWYPLYAHVRRCGHSAHDAQDVTQGFFWKLLEKRWLDSADREKGRLRTFLMVGNHDERAAMRAEGPQPPS